MTEYLEKLNPESLILPSEMEMAAREIVSKLPVARVMADDVKEVADALRRVYNMGRQRGNYESSGGARC